MKITENQIQELYTFTRKHLVEHYDLQTELVDHLANGIEVQWQDHPERSFKEARLIEFRKFGISGFEKVISKRRKAMAKRYRKIVSRFFKEYFRLPKIVFLVLGIGFLFTLITNLTIRWKYDIITALFYILIIFLFVKSFRGRKNNELEQVKYGKKWMLKDQIYEYAGVVNALNLIPLTLGLDLVRDNIPMNNIFVDLIFASAFVCLVVLSYLMVYVIPAKAEELLVETYPEYQIVK